jgi:hypothetical protein
MYGSSSTMTMTRRLGGLIFEDREAVPTVGAADDVTSYRAVSLRRSLKETQLGGT